MPAKDVEAILEKYPDTNRDQLIPILQEVQDKYGFISEGSIAAIGKHLKMPTSNIYGVATFYNQFRFNPKGKYHIRVCYGTACHVWGASTVLQNLTKILKIGDGEITKDKLFSLEVQTCIGGCGQAPVIAVNERYYTRITLESLKRIIQTIQKSEQ